MSKQKSILVIFYSYTGNTRKIANIITENLKEKNNNVDLIQIEDLYPRKGICGFIKSGYESLFSKTPEIKHIELNPELYDLIIIGSPTWAGRLASPMRTFLTKYKNKFKKLGFYCLAASYQKTVFKDMEELQNKPIDTLFIKDNEKQDIINNKINNFIKNLLDQLN